MCSMFDFTFLTIIITFSYFASSVTSTEPHRRYEYMYSFKGPMLVQKDGMIPFWEHGGHAIPSEDKVRLAPSMRNKKGFMWSKKRTTFDSFEIDMSFRVTGRGKVGADGLALWFVEEKTKPGPVYGVGDKWKGLGLFFDTYDNDGQLNNPIILGMLNDGTKSYDHDVDGEGQLLSSCIRDFRNRPFPILIRVRYFNNELSVFINNGNTDTKRDLQSCFTVQNVVLPKQGYFGVSAATGELADDHDVLTFEVHSLTAKEAPSSDKVSEQDREKYEREFAEHMEKMKKAQAEYEKAHAGDKKGRRRYRDQGDEAEEVRRLRQIWEEQTSIRSLVGGVSTKLDLILSRLDKIGTGTGTVSGGEVPHDLVRKDDLNHARDQMTSAISDVKSAMERIRASPDSHPDSAGTSVYELRQMSHDLRESMDAVKDSLRRIDEKVTANTNTNRGTESTGSCPTCLTTSMFVVVTVVNAIVIIGAIFFKLNQEASAKKFY